MASRLIGLDIGSFAVRAAEVNVQGGVATLVRFGQVTLPPDAVRDGEVSDIPAVSAALRRLWEEAGFKERKVAVGVANQRVIVRQAEVAAMTESDLSSALIYEAQELIPIPVDDAILDFRILGNFKNAEGDERMHILLAAAQRDMVRSHIAAVEGADLSVERVDTVPFALVRALDNRDAAASEAAPASEAIVCIGGAVTSIVVHEAGVPRFVRVLLVGGDDLTQAVATELSVDRAQAEDLKRRASNGGGDTQVLQASQVVQTRLSPLVDEIRGSLDYYLAQPDASPISRVVVTGGGSRVTGLVERLEHQLRMEVQVARPLATLKTEDLDLRPDQLEVAESLLAVPIGLALPDYVALDGVRRMNLMPREAAAAKAAKRQLTMAMAGVAAFAVLLGASWVARQTQVSAEERKVEVVEADISRIQRRVTALSDVTLLDKELKANQKLAAQALTGDVEWTRVLTDISAAVPGDVSVRSFTGQAAPTGGTINFGLEGRGHPSAASWLNSVGKLPVFSNVWVPGVSVNTTSNLATFTSSATLTPAANSSRAAAYAPPAPKSKEADK